jgi:hypothetical protein
MIQLPTCTHDLSCNRPLLRHVNTIVTLVFRYINKAVKEMAMFYAFP